MTAKRTDPPKGSPDDDPILAAPPYPSELELRRVRTWPVSDWHGLFAYLRARWNYADVGYWTKRGSTYSISTGGWSGNEELIGALQENHIVWSLCWISSRRGGHYVFRVPTFAPVAGRPALRTASLPAKSQR